MPPWELVLRREGTPDEVISMSADSLYPGVEFFREGVEWVVTEDDSPPQRFSDHAARLVCEPKPS